MGEAFTPAKRGDLSITPILWAFYINKIDYGESNCFKHIFLFWTDRFLRNSKKTVYICNATRVVT